MTHEAAHDPPSEVVILIASWIVLTVLGVVAVRFDERRLARRDPDALARAWPETSRDSALIGLPLLASPLLGLFAVAFHFWRTRRFHPRGLLLGLAAVAIVLAADVAVVAALAWALDVPDA